MFVNKDKYRIICVTIPPVEVELMDKIAFEKHIGRSELFRLALGVYYKEYLKSFKSTLKHNKNIPIENLQEELSQAINRLLPHNNIETAKLIEKHLEAMGKSNEVLSKRS